MSKSKKDAASPKRPDIHGDDDVWTRKDWRHAVAAGDTQLGYWEWVYHLLEMHGVEDSPRYLPQEVSRVLTPFDLWGTPHDTLEMPEAAQFASVLSAIICVGRYNSEQWELIAEHMCILPKTLDEILDRVEKRYGEMIKSVEDHNS